MFYDFKNPNLKLLCDTSKDTLNIDWNIVENNLGFKLHANVKDFHSRIVSPSIDFLVQFQFDKFIKPIGNPKFDAWLSNYRQCIFESELQPLMSLQNIDIEIKYRFEIGGNSNRIWIGQFFTDFGEVSILINNDTGNVEWCDFGYGYFEIYEENPYGILSYDVQEFVELLVSSEKLRKDLIKQNKEH